MVKQVIQITIDQTENDITRLEWVFSRISEGLSNRRDIVGIKVEDVTRKAGKK